MTALAIAPAVASARMSSFAFMRSSLSPLGGDRTTFSGYSPPVARTWSPSGDEDQLLGGGVGGADRGPDGSATTAGVSRAITGVPASALTRDGCTTADRLHAPVGHPICSRCWHDVPACAATAETTPPGAGAMAHACADGMTPNADAGASHSAMTANRAAVVRMRARCFGRLTRSPFSRSTGKTAVLIVK